MISRTIKTLFSLATLLVILRSKQFKLLLKYDFFFLIALNYFSTSLVLLMWLMISSHGFEVVTNLYLLTVRNPDSLEGLGMEDNVDNSVALEIFQEIKSESQVVSTQDVGKCLYHVKRILTTPLLRFRDSADMLEDMNIIRNNQPSLFLEASIRKLEIEGQDNDRCFPLMSELCNMISKDITFDFKSGWNLLFFPTANKPYEMSEKSRGLFKNSFNILDKDLYTKIRNEDNELTMRPCACGSCKPICEIHKKIVKGKDHIFALPSYCRYLGNSQVVLTITLDKCPVKLNMQPWIKYLFPDYSFKGEFQNLLMSLDSNSFFMPKQIDIERDVDKFNEIVDFFEHNQGYFKDKEKIKWVLRDVSNNTYNIKNAYFKEFERKKYRKLYYQALMFFKSEFGEASQKRRYEHLKKNYKNQVLPLPKFYKETKNIFALGEIVLKENVHERVEHSIEGEPMAYEDFEKLRSDIETLRDTFIDELKEKGLVITKDEAREILVLSRNEKALKSNAKIRTVTTQIVETRCDKVEVLYSKPRVPKKKISRKDRKRIKVEPEPIKHKPRENSRYRLTNQIEKVNSKTPFRVLYDLYLTLHKNSIKRTKNKPAKNYNKLTYESFCNHMENDSQVTFVNCMKYLTGRKYNNFRHSILNKLLDKRKAGLNVKLKTQASILKNEFTERYEKANLEVFISSDIAVQEARLLKKKKTFVPDASYIEGARKRVIANYNRMVNVTKEEFGVILDHLNISDVISEVIDKLRRLD